MRRFSHYPSSSLRRSLGIVTLVSALGLALTGCICGTFANDPYTISTTFDLSNVDSSAGVQSLQVALLSGGEVLTSGEFSSDSVSAAGEFTGSMALGISSDCFPFEPAPEPTVVPDMLRITVVLPDCSREFSMRVGADQDAGAALGDGTITVRETLVVQPCSEPENSGA